MPLNKPGMVQIVFRDVDPARRDETGEVPRRRDRGGESVKGRWSECTPKTAHENQHGSKVVPKWGGRIPKQQTKKSRQHTKMISVGM